MFLWKYKEKQFFCFCGHNILTESVFVTHPSTNVDDSVWQIEWLDELPLHEQYKNKFKT